MNSPTAESFYSHKRAAHGGEYVVHCPECQMKWEKLLAESKAKASQH